MSSPWADQTPMRFAVVAGDATDGGDALASQLARELDAAWARGERLSAEELIARHPELGQASSAAVRLVCEEIFLRQEHGQRVDTTEFLRRFPQWRSELEVVLGCHRLFEGSAVPPRFPEAGEEIGEFTLQAEIDRGGMGRVFLARQSALSDRAVVVKFTACYGGEHLSLARLQHMGIVPLYLVQDFPERNLRALCMPYLGGTSLSRLLEEIASVPLARRTGDSLAAVLKHDRFQEYSPVAGGGPALHLLARSSYVEAVCWIGACLADALHYAHQRGLVHLDVKPSNVLLAGDGQPMLLDFHLARAPTETGGSSLDWLGGTPGYMSPEQRRAITALREGRVVDAAVDGRSDIYSLGRLLQEALGGPTSDQQRAAGKPPALRRLNPSVSRGLDDLLCKCLADDPRQRYADAAELARDLRCHLTHLPLRGVANRSLIERWRKWRRRRPQALGRMATLALVGAVLGASAFFFVGDRLQRAQQALFAGRRLREKQAYPEAIERLATGRGLLTYVPANQTLKRAFEVELSRARRDRVSQNMHRLLDRLRYLGGAGVLPLEIVHELESSCAAVWASRDRILRHEPTDAAADRQSADRIDLLELAVLWADLAVRSAAPDQIDAARCEALRRLEEAEAFFGVSDVIERERRRHAGDGSPGFGKSAPLAKPQAAGTAWEHDALGRYLLRDEQLAAAAEEFQWALEDEPQAFWPNYYLGLCNYRLQRYARSLNSFCVCVALAPDSAECFYNRGLAYEALGEPNEASRDYQRAFQLQPGMLVRPETRARIERTPRGK